MIFNFILPQSESGFLTSPLWERLGTPECGAAFKCAGSTFNSCHATSKNCACMTARRAVKTKYTTNRRHQQLSFWRGGKKKSQMMHEGSFSWEQASQPEALESLSSLTCFSCSLAGAAVFAEAEIRKCTRICCCRCCWIWFQCSLKLPHQMGLFPDLIDFYHSDPLPQPPHLVKGQNWILALRFWCTALCQSWRELIK